jgi:protein-L-isoaspartate(D-aspartate) O-methyltransferase
MPIRGPVMPEWASAEHQALRDRLVNQLSRAGHLPDKRLMEALRAIPRHAFLPDVDPELAYQNEAHVTERAVDGRPLSSSSQPTIMAIMLGQLALQQGQRVLEIGAGTGYNAALIAHLVGDRGTVTTVEIAPKLTKRAQERLDAIGLSRVTVACGDGGFGVPASAPYDRIIVTAAAGDLAPAWEQQLADGGRLVVPLRLRTAQCSIAFERANGHLASVSARDCGFMPLRGAFAEPDRVQTLGPDAQLLLELGAQRPVDHDALYTALAAPGQQVPTGIRATVAELVRGLSLWLALREPAIARVGTLGSVDFCSLLPPLIAVRGQVWTAALVGERALAVLVRTRTSPARAGETARLEIGVRGLGPGGRDLAHQLAAHVRDWHTWGRPTTDALKILVTPRGSEIKSGTTVIDMPHTRMVVDWQHGTPGPPPAIPT